MPEIFKDEVLEKHKTEFGKRLVANIDESKNKKSEAEQKLTNK